MSLLLAVVVVVAPGWASWRLLQRWQSRPNPVLCFCLGSVALLGLTLFAADVLGVRWSWITVGAMGWAFVFTGAALRTQPSARSLRPSLWIFGAAAPVLIQAVHTVLSWQPGWDFRYIWGLRAKLFATAGGIDVAWLNWPPNSLHHADYPPLWSSLLAVLVQLRVDVEFAALIWQLILLLGITAACWEALRGARKELQVLACSVGAFAPVVLSEEIGGNADLLVAFLAATAFVLLPRVHRQVPSNGAAVVILMMTVATLVLAKNEGLVLSAGVALGVVLTARRRDSIRVVGAFMVVAVAWRVFMIWHGIADEPRSFSPSHWVDSSGHIFRWLWAERFDLPVALLVAWLATTVALCRRQTAGVVVAISVWISGVAAAYLMSNQALPWHLVTSFDRVVSAPLAGAVAVALSVFEVGDETKTANNSRMKNVRP